jgi:hypothetical protein
MTSASLRRFKRRATRMSCRLVHRVRDSFRSSHVSASQGLTLARMVPERISFAVTSADQVAVRLFCEHRFDLLGSGWVRIAHGMKCHGFEGITLHAARPIGASPTSHELVKLLTAPNRSAALAVRELLSHGYRPIDWQLDFKSGFRWREDTWYRDIRYGHVAGADVKVPWELSRMQHLPDLALGYAVSNDSALTIEFRDQVLDWIAANPPRFGVNWASTLEVAIRVANWLFAFDLFRAAGASFDSEFERIFAASVLAHARHIVDNLEWSETWRANHYLGNVAGLLVAAAYLPATQETDSWLLFATQEIIDETARQFLEDGGHFEASTSYHRLCGEMVGICAVVLRSLSQDRLEGLFACAELRFDRGPRLRGDARRTLREQFDSTGELLPGAFYLRIARAAAFTRSLSRRDGSVPQIGDNDSGRFLRLGGWGVHGTKADCRDRYANPIGLDDLDDRADYVAQAHANHQQWLGWAAAVLGRPELLNAGAENQWANALALGDAMIRSPSAVARAGVALAARVEAGVPRPTEVGARASTSATENLERVRYERSGVYVARVTGLLTNCVCECFADFGVYVFRSQRMHLAIRCGRAVSDVFGVHAHDDQLAFDLAVDMEHVAIDPGTYVYTPSASWRNRYRSAYAHHVPTTAPRPPLDGALFGPPRTQSATCLRFDDRVFVGRALIAGGDVTRTVSLQDDRIEVRDVYQLLPGWTPASDDPFRRADAVGLSPGYGVRYR